MMTNFFSKFHLVSLHEEYQDLPEFFLCNMWIGYVVVVVLKFRVQQIMKTYSFGKLHYV